MGNKGVQRRRRNALAANSANLHKAQFGKATKFDKLPDAPKSTDFAQRVSKSTRKVQQLMAMMTSQSGGQQQAEPVVPEGPLQDANTGADCQTRTAGQDAAERRPQNLDGAGSSAPAKISKTKLKRKNHLADKKVEKRKKVQDRQNGGKKKDEQKDDFKSNAFKLEHVPFGEVADAPPQVSLKRKNHVDENGTASRHRHTVALQKHLQAGQAKLLKGLQGNSDAREAVMGAYRVSKSKQTMQVASMDSLKALVRRQAVSQ